MREEPRREEYMADEPHSKEDGMSVKDGEEVLDNEGINILFWEHLLEYEQTQLRRLFISEMRKLDSGWIREFESEKNTLKADFDRAVHNCDNGFCVKIIGRWLDALKNGEKRSLMDVMKE